MDIAVLLMLDAHDAITDRGCVAGKPTERDSAE
jgi:hypothetical protein